MYVRKTQDIWTDIERGIRAMFAERRTHAADWHSYGLTKQAFDDLVLQNLITPEQQELMDKLGPRFFSKFDKLTVNLVSSAGQKSQYVLNFSPAKSLPGNWDSYYDESRPSISHPSLAEIASKRIEKTAAVSKEEQKLIADVKKLYEAVPSVNRFVLMWPPALDLLDKDVVNKLNEKVEREAPVKAAADIVDLNELNVQLLKARVAA